MKEYIKPEVEVIEYSFEDIIANSKETYPETDVPDAGADSGLDDSFNDFFT